MAKEIDKQIVEAAALKANKKAFIGAVKRGALYEGLYTGLVSGGQDTMMQLTSIEAGINEKFDYGRLGLNTAFGAGMGTVFGGAFSAGGFKIALRGQKKNTIKNLYDVHNYGFDEITGTRLFDDLSEVRKGKQ